ncbi:hypothetical protein BH683_002545 [Williamsia sp. 1138]|nr:hypothetical protein BH683_002545 [Williamsia sp. 1138]
MTTVIYVAAEVEQARYLFGELRRWVCILELETHHPNAPAVVFLKQRELDEIHRLMDALISEFPEAFVLSPQPVPIIAQDAS